MKLKSVNNASFLWNNEYIYNVIQNASRQLSFHFIHLCILFKAESHQRKIFYYPA